MLTRFYLFMCIVGLCLNCPFSYGQNLIKSPINNQKYQIGAYGFAKYTSTRDPDLGDYEEYFNSHFQINLSQSIWKRPSRIKIHDDLENILLGGWDMHFGSSVFLGYSFVKWKGQAKSTKLRVYPYFKLYSPINLFGIVSAGIDLQWWASETIISGSGTKSLFTSSGIGGGYDLGVGYCLPLNPRLFLEFLVSYHHPTIYHTNNAHIDMVEKISTIKISVGFQLNIFEQ